MPSHLHEALVLLFRNQPELAADLLREALRQSLPAYREARVASAELNELQPTEYRADAVIVLRRRAPVLGIVVEVQLRRSAEKRFVWPAYVVGLRARLRCPVNLLVLTPVDSVAAWAARPIDLGGGNRFVPLVVGPDGVPVVSSMRTAKRDPELAVLSTIAHGQRLRPGPAARLARRAIAATKGLDDERGAMYFDLILVSLSAAAREELQAMEPVKYEYQSDFAKRYFGKGIAEGQVQGRVEILATLLAERFGRLSAQSQARLKTASAEQIDLYARRVLTAASVREVFAPDPAAAPSKSGARPRRRRLAE